MSDQLTDIGPVCLSADKLNAITNRTKTGNLFTDSEVDRLHLLSFVIHQHNVIADLQSQLAALKLENEKLVELAVGAKLFAQHHHSCACLFGFGLRPCTCGLTALRAEIERVKETKEQQKP